MGKSVISIVPTEVSCSGCNNNFPIKDIADIVEIEI
jgi:hypothetical protein